MSKFPRILPGLAASIVVLALAASAGAEPLATIPKVVASHTAALVAKPAADKVLHLVISLPLRNMPGLDALLTDIYEPASPNYGHYLSAAEFTERFDPTAADYSTAVRFFTDQGMTVTQQTENRYLIDVDAKVADVERVFHVNMRLYQHPTENRLFVSADRAPTLNFAMPLQEVIGLNDFVKPHPKSLHRATAPISRGGSGPGGQFDGHDIRKAYYPTGALNGAGQSIGLMELAGLNISDVNLFTSSKYGGGSKVPIRLIKTDSLATTCTPPDCTDDGEQALDVEYAIAMAPGLASVRVYVGNTAEDVLNKMATENISKALSTSWGWDENFATDDGLFKRFAAQGQTNLTASGDYSSLSASGPWPEEDLHIVAVGGTDLSMSGAGGAWSGETGWADSAGGPSLDTSIKIATYQKPYVTGANGASSTLRNVPDIAASANFDMEICANGTCQGGWGGTSFASPIWAGFIALTNQYAKQNGKPLVGFINPRVYALGHNVNYHAWFHDQTQGTSGLYSCTPSWDMVTGLGSPTGQSTIVKLVN